MTDPYVQRENERAREDEEYMRRLEVDARERRLEKGPAFATYCPHCFTGDPGEDYCGSCGERI